MIGRLVPRRRLACLVLSALLGCSTSDDDRSGSPAELWCDGYCRLEETCAPVRDRSCQQSCVNDRPGLANFSVNGARLVGDCVAGFDCLARYDMATWDAALDGCWENAQTVIEPTQHVRTFCASFIESWFECGFWFAQGECESIYGMWSDAVVDRLAQCGAQLDCGAFDSCLANVFETL